MAGVLPFSLLPSPLLLFLLLPLPLLLLLLPLLTLEEFLLYSSFFPLDGYIEGVSRLAYVFLASLSLLKVVACPAKVLPGLLDLNVLLLLREGCDAR